MKSENLTPDTCLMVGDREFDILGAKEVGIPAVGVTYGYGTRQELTDARADKIACSVAELQEILCGEMA
jgi:phosphoglycolate phosphatase